VSAARFGVLDSYCFFNLGPFCFGLGSSSLSSPGIVPISGEAGLFALMSLWCPSSRLAR
jgi:hypothetical protein